LDSLDKYEWRRAIGQSRGLLVLSGDERAGDGRPADAKRLVIPQDGSVTLGRVEVIDEVCDLGVGLQRAETVGITDRDEQLLAAVAG